MLNLGFRVWSTLARGYEHLVGRGRHTVLRLHPSRAVLHDALERERPRRPPAQPRQHQARRAARPQRREALRQGAECVAHLPHDRTVISAGTWRWQIQGSCLRVRAIPAATGPRPARPGPQRPSAAPGLRACRTPAERLQYGHKQQLTPAEVAVALTVRALARPQHHRARAAPVCSAMQRSLALRHSTPAHQALLPYLVGSGAGETPARNPMHYLATIEYIWFWPASCCAHELPARQPASLHIL